MADFEDLAQVLAGVGQRYPRLQPHVDQSVATYGTPSGPGDNRQLEFYHPWDTHNPNPGKNTLEIYNRNLQGPDLQAAVAGDLLHRLGSMDPTTGQAVDPRWRQMRQDLVAARSPQGGQADVRTWLSDNQRYGYRPYSQWRDHSRDDAYVRAALFPEQNPEWQRGAITPGMQPTIAQMRDYLRGE